MDARVLEEPLIANLRVTTSTTTTTSKEERTKKREYFCFMLIITIIIIYNNNNTLFGFESIFLAKVLGEGNEPEDQIET